MLTYIKISPLPFFNSCIIVFVYLPDDGYFVAETFSCGFIHRNKICGTVYNIHF
jgi:hypothetical protein